MSNMLADILNESIDCDKSYLELGCYIKYNFNKVKFTKKVCVDVEARFNPTFCMTTDQFFKNNKEKFDIIFIDANHNLDFVVSDYINSVNFANEIIVMHDMIPPSEMHTDPGYCSDSYKFLAYLYESGFEIYPMNDDCGLTFVFKPYPIIDRNKISHISYAEFLEKNVKTYTRSQIVEIIRSKGIK